MFARVKYLCDYGLIIATLFARVFVVRHQMTCCRFLCILIGHTCGLLKKKPISFVASYQMFQCNTSQVP